MKELTFDRFSVVVPDDWEEIATQLGQAGLPPTFARDGGVGALQVLVSASPNLLVTDLRRMMSEFAARNDLIMRGAVTEERGRITLIGANFRQGPSVLRIWYLTDGTLLGRATYSCTTSDLDSELSECEGIVRSLRFAALE